MTADDLVLEMAESMAEPRLLDEEMADLLPRPATAGTPQLELLGRQLRQEAQLTVWIVYADLLDRFERAVLVRGVQWDVAGYVATVHPMGDHERHRIVLQARQKRRQRIRVVREQLECDRAPIRANAGL